MTFAILHFGTGFTISFLLTGSIAIAGSIALIEPLVNTVVYYLHEQVWAANIASRLKTAWRRIVADRIRTTRPPGIGRRIDHFDGKGV